MRTAATIDPIMSSPLGRTNTVRFDTASIPSSVLSSSPPGSLTSSVPLPYRHVLTSSLHHHQRMRGLSTSTTESESSANAPESLGRSPPHAALVIKPSPPLKRRIRYPSLGSDGGTDSFDTDRPPLIPRSNSGSGAFVGGSGRKLLDDTLAQEKTEKALKTNDSMIYLEGPHVYSCAHCRTHLTSHAEIVSKSFHGRHGRAFLFEKSVNIMIGPAEDRMLMTGLHSVCDIYCKRCQKMIGWTYKKAYEASQKYKEGKYIIEKINLHMEESDHYDVLHPAGERPDRWRQRSMGWAREALDMTAMPTTHEGSFVYEYLESH